MPEMTVMAVDIQTRMFVMSIAGCSEKASFMSMIAAIIAIICDTVLIFPSILAAITLPSATASMRTPETINSRASTIMTAMQLTLPCSKSTRNAAVVSILSASGSINLPKVVIWL